jgi:hypothetical protein
VYNDRDCSTAKQVIEEAFKNEFRIVPAIEMKKYKAVAESYNGNGVEVTG